MYNIRSTYKKEQKVAGSKKSGAGTSEIYSPKPWFYPLLAFLNEQEEPRFSRSNIIDDNIPEEELIDETQPPPAAATGSETLPATETTSGAQPATASTSGTLPATDSTSELNASSSVVPPSNSKAKRPGKRNAVTSNDNLTADVLRSVQNHFKKPVHNNDGFDIFGTNVAAKLRDLKKQQRILAEKLINETLFEAEMENLTTFYRVMDLANVRFDYNTPSPSTIIHTPSPITYTPSPVHFDTISNSQDNQPMLTNTHISIPDSAATNLPNFDINTN
ncbi:hypothetical protein JTB14_020766 [Gonioctena quinquepunctata]|nr:hypothetical protein JTB14_020766 [Gonioctena quinquepunctata]